MKKVLTVVGARPQFVKAAVVSRSMDFADDLDEVIVHTGQHFDKNMSDIFFSELDIPFPKYNMNISGFSHGDMTGKMISSIEEILLIEKPNMVLLYGDTNSTLAGAIAAVKLHIPISHVEAGLRSHNKLMPEEINRLLTDHAADILFCPTKCGAENLEKEGISSGVHVVGDVMYDASLFYKEKALNTSDIISKLELVSGSYVLATCHRAENTESPEKLKNIFKALDRLAESIDVVFPVHPRTRNKMNHMDWEFKRVKTVEPLPFFDIIALEAHAKAIVTDSGGMQKEAFFFQKPCVTIRDETEWLETIELNANRLVSPIEKDIIDTVNDLSWFKYFSGKNPYGDGDAGKKIVDIIRSSL